MQDWEINDKFRQLAKELNNIRNAVNAKTISKERSTFKNKFNDIDSGCVLCINDDGVDIPRFSPVIATGYDTDNGMITIGLPSEGNEIAVLGITQHKVADGAKVRIKVSGLSLIRTDGEAIVIGDQLYAYDGENYVGTAGDMSASTIFKSFQNSIESVSYVYCSVGSGGSSNFVYWSQASEPTPTAGKFNIWKDTDNGHVAFYLDDLDPPIWARVTGFM